jgi:hypothetical protein
MTLKERHELSTLEHIHVRRKLHGDEIVEDLGGGGGRTG